MVHQVECFPKIYKHRSNNIPTVYTRHPFVYQFYKCCLTAMFLTTLDISVLYSDTNSFKNASRVRQSVMERCAGTWEKFTEMFNSTPPGNNGYIGIAKTD